MTSLSLLKKNNAQIPDMITFFNILSYLNDSFIGCEFSKTAALDYKTIYGMKYTVYETNYSRKYEVAVDKYGKPIRTSVNIEGSSRYLLLSRIPKKNGKHRYYLTLENSQLNYIGCACGYFDCRDSSCMATEPERFYRSLYIGKDFINAVERFVCFKDRNETKREREERESLENKEKDNDEFKVDSYYMKGYGNVEW